MRDQHYQPRLHIVMRTLRKPGHFFFEMKAIGAPVLVMAALAIIVTIGSSVLAYSVGLIG